MKTDDFLMLAVAGVAVFFLLKKLKGAQVLPAPPSGFSAAGSAPSQPYDWVVPGSQQDAMLQAQFPSLAFG